jgi:hypothetical protein
MAADDKYTCPFQGNKPQPKKLGITESEKSVILLIVMYMDDFLP